MWLRHILAKASLCSGFLFGMLVLSTSMSLLALADSVTPPPQLSRFLAHHGFAAKDVGYVLFDPTTGCLLASHRADEPCIPASTTKVATLIAALRILGADYQFKTSVFATGVVEAGTLHGNLYLWGGGDPTLSTEDLRGFVRTLHRAGIKRVTGSFAFDESFLTQASQIDTQQPVAASYNPGVSALSLNYNRIQLRWRSQSNGVTFRTTVLSPATGGFLPVPEIDTGLLPRGVDRRIKFLYAGAEMDRWLLSRTLPPKGHIMLPVKMDPGRVAALLFRRLCQQHGIKVPEPQPARVPAQARLLYTHRSARLSEIITGVLRYSNNLSAELIGQVAARRLSDQPLSLHGSATVLTDWYRQTLPDTDWGGFLSINHSGLSNTSRHSPRQLAAILRYGWTLPSNGLNFLQLLPRLSWKQANKRPTLAVRAKSGTMNYADGLVGFLTAASGRQLGFVVLITDFPRRAVFDATFDRRFVDAPPEVRAWTSRAKKLERALITAWATQY